jgi:hypothetical protein
VTRPGVFSLCRADAAPSQWTVEEKDVFFIVSLIALALALSIAIAANFWAPTPSGAVQDVHLVVLMFFASPAIATVYGGLVLIVCNLISSWLGWPELSLPWWPQRPGRAAVTISWYIIVGWWGVFVGAIALVWYYA